MHRLGRQQDKPKNFVLDWKAGQTLAEVLSNTLQTALPRIKQSINLSSRLTRGYDGVGYYPTLEALSRECYLISKSIITDPGYAGVSISLTTDTVIVSDFTQQPNAVKEILFQDLIGQPTWLDATMVQAKTAMRGDIQPLDVVGLPRGLVTNSASTFGRFRDNSIFTGKYLVQRIHFYGDFRQPDAASWNTTFDLSLQAKAGTP